ncbi:MAG: 4-amino-6-deoxy-N-Acetyl-D-hexosaminyl-(Lipid carrier) acetyltrasferase [Candidatus Jettenia ecosi]|uniref:4-amino-6-deoxy-N-Acetyl-D-hexosaminyl-(Lipid carrier) acetyltrasferase n=1 Tax=Candidatus Jettenia ecosi TaxID=2494326 RepID=A0A533Q961_9BACT|nr:MAG: 4-amino-6-deoxy-N-Acetyl-D-hexosaminyl-(Lipid carrier) acetyltrasferase [Candidatus Jettenia ecosi]
MEEIVLIGGGGHCKSCIEVIEAEDKFKIIGIVDTKEKLRQKVLGYEVIACDEDLPKLVKEHKNFLIAIEQIKSPEKRIEKFEYLKSLGANFPVIISPLSHVSKHATIGEGTIIMHNVIVNAGTTIGKNCIINTGAIIEHDAVIGNRCHISTGAIINGGTKVKEGTFFGSNSMAKEYIEIGENSIIGGE